MIWRKRRRQSSDADVIARAGSYWSQRQNAPPEVVSWWQNPLVVEHVNSRICGNSVAGVSGGDVDLLRQHLDGATLARGVSVGAGSALKEMALLEAGLVEHFDLYEVAEERILFAEAHAEQKGMSERITWHRELIDFEAPHPSVDLVYWNSALHHMLDVEAATRWSRQALRDGGIFFMNDFVGPNRMQWGDEMLAAANEARATLPPRMFERKNARAWPQTVQRPKLAEMIAKDPTECADSDAILPQLAEVFPDAQVHLTGGVIYHLALHGLYGNFTAEDEPLLEQLLRRDDELAEGGLTHFAVAVAKV